MDIQQKYFEVWPRVVPADQESVIHIRPRYAHTAIPDLAHVQVRLCPVDGIYPSGAVHQTPTETKEDERPKQLWLEADGTLCIRADFASEQEYDLQLTLTQHRYGYYDKYVFKRADGTVFKHMEPKDIQKNFRFNLFSVKEDLYSLRPFKGDFHMHSCDSDGSESPEYVAARCREMGMDFMALTDHFQYHPSEKVRACWKDLKNGFRMWNGEEVHLPDNPVHVVNFNGRFSVNDLAYGNEPKYRAEVLERTKTMTDVPEAVRFMVASCEWAFDRIREGGGIAMFCHPYWQRDHYDIPEQASTAILRRRKFDVFEVLGGYWPCQWRSNDCQVARWYEEALRGNRFPIAGVSDSHSTDSGALAGWYTTIILAKSDAFEDLANSIRKGLTAAVDTVHADHPNMTAEFRLLRYMSFLEDEYFSLTKLIQQPEGALMVRALGGSETARAMLMAGNDETAAFRERFFGRSC